MHRLHFAFLVSLLLLPSGVLAASGDMGKLDPRARIALAQLRAGVPLGQMLENEAAVSGEGQLDVFIRGTVSRAQLEAAGARVRTALPGLFTAFVPAGAIEAVAALPGVRGIAGSVRAEPELDASVLTTGANLLRGAGPDFAGLNGAGVLVGDVDSGVDFGHGDFKDPLGNTRFVNIWDQTDVGGTPPPVYGYGVEWSSAQIDGGACGEVDASSGHGTHVLGIAAGDGSQTGGAIPEYTYAGMAPKADLVMVKTNFQTTGILDGVSYVFDVATARGQNAVCNLSLGSHFGPHDGTSDFEAGLSALTGPGRVVCKSAGNERGQARHAQVFAAGAGTDATMSVSGSAVGRQFAIDGYYESTENVSVRIRTPNGTIIGPILRGAVNAAYPGTATPNGTVYLENGAYTTSTGDYEVYIEVIAATLQSMNGTWTFTFIPVALGAANGEVDLWRFYNTTTTANFVTGNSPNQELISEPGNADSLITVAAWVTKQNWICCNGTNSTFTGTPAVGNIAQFSSPGPTRDGRQKPEIAAPGIAIGSTTSFDIAQICPAAGTPSTLLPDDLNHVVNAGTSMAAPHATGAVALLMQNHGAVTPSEAKAFFAAYAVVDAFTGAVWNKDWGFGKLSFASTLPVPENVPSADFVLDRVRPNPATKTAQIGFSVPRATHVKVTVLDLQGRIVAALADRSYLPGHHQLTWDGRWGGRAAPAGLYFIRVVTPDQSLVQRVVLAH
jgi:subtilisin family serine protease